MIIVTRRIKNYHFAFILIIWAIVGCSFVKKQSHEITIEDVEKNGVFEIKPDGIHPFKADVIVESSLNITFSLEVSDGNRSWYHEGLGEKGHETIYSGDWYDNPMTIKYQGNQGFLGNIKISVVFFY